MTSNLWSVHITELYTCEKRRATQDATRQRGHFVSYDLLFLSVVGLLFGGRITVIKILDSSGIDYIHIHRY